MNIAIIEDNIHKRNKITSFLESHFENITYSEASSYSSGINLIEGNTFDFLILDMTMPTYDITKTDSGGRFRTEGGKEILKRLKRKKKLLPFIIVTQYSTFSETTGVKTLETMRTEIKNLFPEHFKSLIFYDTTSTSWKEELSGVLEIL